MKKIFLLAVVFGTTLLLSCSKESDLEFHKNSRIEDSRKYSERQVSLKKVKAISDIFKDNLYSDNVNYLDLSSRRNVSNVKNKEIDFIDYKVSELGDTLMFAVNYKDNRGFIVISGDNHTYPILAHSDTGKFEFDVSENNPLSFWISDKSAFLEENIRKPIDLDNEKYEEWKYVGDPDYVYEILPENNLPEISISGRRKHSSGKGTIYPYTGMALKWNQGKAYNYDTPNGNKAVGCPAVAIGMLAYDMDRNMRGYKGKSPYYLSYAWSHYTGHHSHAVSKMFRNIADSIPNYIWGTSLSGAKPLDILVGLHSLGFTDASFKDYDFEEAYQNMKNKKYGVLLVGYSTKGGHIWFCDGYYEQKWKVRRKFLGIATKTWYEYEDKLYMNWGWNTNNGWFTYDDFGSYKHGKKMYVDLDYKKDTYVQ